MVQQDTAWRGRQGRAVDEVEVGGGLGGGGEGEGGEEAGEVVLRGGVVCGELEAGDGCSYAEEDGAETFWALEYVGGVCVADVPVLETGGLHEEAEGAGGGGHRGGGGGSGESPRKHVNKAPRLASPPFPLSLSPPRASTPTSHRRSTAMPATLHAHAPPPPTPAAEHPADHAAHAPADSPGDAAHPAAPSDQRAKKKRLGVDPSLIIAEGGRSKRRRTPSPQPEQKEQVNTDPRDSARAKELGMVIYERIMGSKTKE